MDAKNIHVVHVVIYHRWQRIKSLVGSTWDNAPDFFSEFSCPVLVAKIWLRRITQYNGKSRKNWIFWDPIAAKNYAATSKILSSRPNIFHLIFFIIANFHEFSMDSFYLRESSMISHKIFFKKKIYAMCNLRNCTNSCIVHKQLWLLLIDIQPTPWII